MVQPRNEAASPETRYKGWKMKKIYHLSSIVPSTGSLPLRLAHGRADAGVQAGHGHHGLRVHQGLDHRSQTWSLDPLDQSWVLYQALEILSPCIKDFYPHTDSLLSEKKQRIARNNKRSDFANSLEIVQKFLTNFLQKIICVFRNLDSVTPSPVFDTVEMFWNVLLL